MHSVRDFVRRRLRESVERDRRAESRIEAISHVLWRWPEQRLVALVGLMALLDYATTTMALELSGKTHVYEGGLLAGWALRVGGLGWLFLVDMGVVAALVLLAIAARRLYSRFGYTGFGRAAFVAVLVPYAVVAASAAVNNLIVTFA
jgi:hypothetical protein